MAPELTYILQGKETRPITRILIGTWYALSMPPVAGHVADRLNRPVQTTTSSDNIRVYIHNSHVHDSAMTPEKADGHNQPPPRISGQPVLLAGTGTLGAGTGTGKTQIHLAFAQRALHEQGRRHRG